MKNKMRNIFRRGKAVLVCQFGQDAFKAVKFLSGAREVAGLEAVDLSAAEAKKDEVRIVSALLKKPAYRNLPVIVCLPRYKITFRFLKKVPAQSPGEIENIVLLQASRCLPYPAEELISGYQIVSMDQDGCSDVNMAVVHEQAVEHALEAFKGQRYPRICVSVSSYGLLNFYNYLKPGDNEAVMLVDADADYPEIAITKGTVLLFSRAFKLDRGTAGWQEIFIGEINKTQAAYFKEMSVKPPEKLVLLGCGKTRDDLLDVLNNQPGFSVSAPGYGPVKFAAGLKEQNNNTDFSFASLVGLGIKDCQESLNFVPARLKDISKKSTRRKEFLRLGLFIFGIAVILGLGIARNLDDKSAYLAWLKGRLNSIAKEAGPLEEMERKLNAIEGRTQRSPTVLDALHELYRLVRPPVTLMAFSYEEADRLVIRGQSPELDPVFDLAGRLERSAAFGDFAVKVNYVTKKMTASGEVSDFEIECLRKKR